MRPDLRQTVRGMRDLLPDETWRLRFIEGCARRLAELYGYEEVITPIIEYYELLAAKIGEENRKRMYVFEDLGGRKVALRPEFTASIARLVSTRMVSAPKPIRLFSFGSLYRYDEPQLGRYREFWQANYELIGSDKPEADAEILSLTSDFLEAVGLRNYVIKINHVGVLRGILGHEGISEDGQNSIMQLLDKKDWDGALKLAEDYGASQRCVETLKRLFNLRSEDKNAVFKGVSEAVEGYPSALEALDNFSGIIDLVERIGLKIRFQFEASFARGLEYYTGVIFEVYVPELNIAVGGGGRYDRLIGLFGGIDMPAIGVAFGVDRIMLAMEEQGVNPPKPERKRVLVVAVDENNVADALKIAVALRRHGVQAEIDVMRRGLSRALSDADRRRIAYAIIVGPKELGEGKVILRDMRNKVQEEIRIEDLPGKLSVF
ncbi:histidine--tRNA ligase [Candidatus Bathyarchaeota archaeon]|nr:histidine--tRNA ligase [Candidatus Bathyarchaeota archaeon]